MALHCLAYGASFRIGIISVSTNTKMVEILVFHYCTVPVKGTRCQGLSKSRVISFDFPLSRAHCKKFKFSFYKTFDIAGPTTAPSMDTGTPSTVVGKLEIFCLT